MIGKPQGYDDAVAMTAGDFPRLPAGGYVCKVINVKLGKSQNGNEMLILALDIAEGQYEDFFRKQYDRMLGFNKDAKWPCLYRQVTCGNSVGLFKGMVSAFEKSNPGFAVTFPFDESTLARKIVGGAFREEEYIRNDGKSAMSIRCFSLRPVEGITEIEPPAPKMLEQTQTAQTFGGQAISNEAIPF